MNDVCASQFAWAKPVVTDDAASFASDGGLIMTSGGNANGHAAVSKAVCMLVRTEMIQGSSGGSADGRWEMDAQIPPGAVG